MLASSGGPPLLWGMVEKFAARDTLTARRLVTPWCVRSFVSPVRGLLLVSNRFAARLRSGLRVLAFLLAAIVCLARSDAFVQTPAQTAAQKPAHPPALAPAQSPAKNAAPAQTTATAPPVDAASVMQFLDQTIAWYHQLGAQQKLVADANDDVYVSADHQMADEVVRLVFQFARTQAE